MVLVLEVPAGEGGVEMRSLGDDLGSRVQAGVRDRVGRECRIGVDEGRREERVVSLGLSFGFGKGQDGREEGKEGEEFHRCVLVWCVFSSCARGLV